MLSISNEKSKINYSTVLYLFLDAKSGQTVVEQHTLSLYLFEKKVIIYFLFIRACSLIKTPKANPDNRFGRLIKQGEMEVIYQILLGEIPHMSTILFFKSLFNLGSELNSSKL